MASWNTVIGWLEKKAESEKEYADQIQRQRGNNRFNRNGKNPETKLVSNFNRKPESQVSDYTKRVRAKILEGKL